MFEVNPKFITEEERVGYGRFVIEPLPAGYGTTIGNALRRVLLSSLPGAAITQIKIDGVKHEFSVIKGVKEDVVELILNIKGVQVKLDKDEAILKLDAKGPGGVKAGDIKAPTGAEILNKDWYLASLADKKTKLSIEFKVEKGKGYIPAEEREVNEIGMIPIDAVFSPVLQVNYSVSATRVGRMTNFDKLLLEIITDGSLKASDGLVRGAEILKDYFLFITDPSIAEVAVSPDQGKKGPQIDLKASIEEFDLSTRVVNSLHKAGITTVEDLINKEEKEITKVKNLGSKSIRDIKKKLEQYNLSFKKPEAEKEVNAPPKKREKTKSK